MYAPRLPDRNFGNQGFLIENQEFIRSFFSEVQEVFISSLKDEVSIFLRCIIENWTLQMQRNAFAGSLLHSRRNAEKQGIDSHSFLNFHWSRLLNLNNDDFAFLHMMRSSAYREIKSVLTLNQFPERKSLLEREVGFSEGNRFQELT